MPAFSLKQRIGLHIAGLVVLIITTISAVAYHEFREAMIGSLDAKLQSDMATIRYFLSDKDLYSAEAQQEIRAFLSTPMKHYATDCEIWLENGNGSPEILVSMELYEPMKAQQIAPPELNGTVKSDLTADKKAYRVRWTRYPVSTASTETPRILNIALAASSSTAVKETREFVKVLLIFGGIVLLVTLLLIRGILEWGLKPVDSLAGRMRKISASNLNEVRLDYTDAPGELVPFVTAWQKMLNKLAHAMDEQKRFTADAAHELRTPIALIKSTLQLAQSQKRSADYYEETIDRSLEDLERLNGLIEQLLQLSRLENAHALQEREVFNLADLIKEVTGPYEPLLHEKGFEFAMQLEPAEIRGNQPQIRQLVLNLIDNAVQYAPPQTTITLSLEARDGLAVMTVHDEGGGIPEAECGRLFDRFYRVSKARDRHSGGTGLGLAIAKEIATLHGGNITVESTPQTGTRFIVTLEIQ